MNNNYEIGYKKPPKNGQFKPGQSGNPKGRRKGFKNFATDLEEEIYEPITIAVNGKTKKISKRKAILKQHINKALKGDLASTKFIFELCEKYKVLTKKPRHKPDFSTPEAAMKALDEAIREVNESYRNE